MAAPTTLSYIYCIRERGTRFCKIGISGNIAHRRMELQVGNPRVLYVDAVVPGDVEVERGLHERFSDYWETGEWFHDRDGKIATWFGNAKRRASADFGLTATVDARSELKYLHVFGRKGLPKTISTKRAARMCNLPKMAVEALSTQYAS